MYPERTRNLWLATSASAGASRRVGIKSLDQRCMIVFSSCFHLELENPLFYRIARALPLNVGAPSFPIFRERVGLDFRTASICSRDSPGSRPSIRCHPERSDRRERSRRTPIPALISALHLSPFKRRQHSASTLASRPSRDASSHSTPRIRSEERRVGKQ